MRTTIYALATLVFFLGCGETPEEKAARELRVGTEQAEGQEALAKFYAEHPKTAVVVPPRAEIAPETGTGYLDSRTGPALERTVKRAIGMAGYNCEAVRGTKQSPGKVVADCGADGSYLLIETGGDIRVAKQ